MDRLAWAVTRWTIAVMVCVIVLAALVAALKVAWILIMDGGFTRLKK